MFGSTKLAENTEDLRLVELKLLPFPLDLLNVLDLQLDVKPFAIITDLESEKDSLLPKSDQSAWEFNSQNQSELLLIIDAKTEVKRALTSTKPVLLTT